MLFLGLQNYKTKSNKRKNAF